MRQNQPEWGRPPLATPRNPDAMPERDSMVFLQPGEVWTTDTPTLVKTVLGSCVAITMRAPRLGLASVTHCLLPTAGSQAERLTREEALRYVDTTIGILIDTFARRGAAVPELEVKLIGGADNLLSGSPSRYLVGRRNVETALEGLAAWGVTPAAVIAGGRVGRVLVFDTVTGGVFIKLLSPARRLSGEEL